MFALSFSPTPRIILPRIYHYQQKRSIASNSNSNRLPHKTIPMKPIFNRNSCFVLNSNDNEEIQTSGRTQQQSREYKDRNNNHKRKRNNDIKNISSDITVDSDNASSKKNKNGKRRNNIDNQNKESNKKVTKVKFKKESFDVVHHNLSKGEKQEKENDKQQPLNSKKDANKSKSSSTNPGTNENKKTQNRKKKKKSFKNKTTNNTNNQKKDLMHDLFYHPSSDDKTEKTPNPLNGAVPVKELFYQSTQSLSTSSDDDNNNNDKYSTNMNRDNDDDDDEKEKHDDEELPFSAEQSNKITVPKNNKIQVRRNFARKQGQQGSQQQRRRNGINKFPKNKNYSKGSSSPSMSSRNKNSNSKFSNRKNYNGKNKSYSNNRTQNNRRRFNNNNNNNSGRKIMVRRGMEMLVGGEPINADPPLRFMELYYDTEVVTSLTEEDKDCYYDWASVISINSRDFGPLLHNPSISKVSNNTRGLFCENLIDKLIKWNICPDDILSLVNDTVKKQQERDNTMNNDNAVSSKKNEKLSYKELLHLINGYSFNNVEKEMQQVKAFAYGNNNTSFSQPSKILSSSSFVGHHLSVASSSSNTNQEQQKNEPSNDNTHRPTTSIRNVVNSKDDIFVLQGGELKFSLGLPKAILACNSYSKYHALKHMLRQGISSAIQAKELGFIVKIVKLTLSTLNDDEEQEDSIDCFSNDDDAIMSDDYDEQDNDEITQVSVQFTLFPSYTTKKSFKNKKSSSSVKSIMKKVNLINLALSHSVDEGHMALHLAAATRREKAWSDDLKEKIIEEILFEIDDGDVEDDFMSNDDVEEEEEDDDAEDEDTDAESNEYNDENTNDKPKQLSSSKQQSSKLSSPYKGTLGPILLDSVISKARQRYPRVIAIGDVHGCLDELQALLKKCDYRPGDQVIFLGDLVSKGPDSTGVVQMAREIGALGVRGNHDFEVIRWHQAIKSGADPPVIGSEHYRIASNLAKPELKWLYSLPWYISSKELNALFVHAGFVSGIKLSKQNPRLMMNMRSILPDGTVTSKYFNNWPWARLWDGPQTVLFGHDADRNLQQYEHAIGLDTGCVYGGRLTACILPDKKLVSVPAKREYFQYRRKHFD